MHDRLESAALPGVARQDLTQVTLSVAPGLHDRLNDQMESQSLAISLHRNRVDQERHVVIDHFNDYRDEYVAFSVILTGCIDGLDSCFAGEEDNPEMRLRVLQTLFAIYRFYTESGMDLDEDIPGLLVGNTTPGERRVIASWARDALTHKAAWSSGERYETLLAALERTN